jgi:hypothetical protein
MGGLTNYNLNRRYKMSRCKKCTKGVSLACGGFGCNLSKKLYVITFIHSYFCNKFQDKSKMITGTLKPRLDLEKIFNEVIGTSYGHCHYIDKFTINELVILTEEAKKKKIAVALIAEHSNFAQGVLVELKMIDSDK